MALCLEGTHVEQDWFDPFVKGFYAEVEDIFEFDEFRGICAAFQDYSDDDRRQLPFGICELIAASKRIGHDSSYFTGIQLVLISSVIEMVMSRREYRRFDMWLTENKDIVKDWKCLRAWQEYVEKYGAARNFRKFFSDLPTEDKLRLLTELQKKQDGGLYAPFCFQSQDKCFRLIRSWRTEGDQVKEESQYEYRCKGERMRDECPALSNSNILRDGIRDFANHLYQLRSDFVHQSKLPSFSTPPPRKLGFDRSTTGDTKVFYGYSVRTQDGTCERFTGTLSTRDLYDLLKKHLPELLITYRNEVSL